MSVVYGMTANVAGVAIRNFRIGPSLSNRIGVSDSNSNQISKLRRSLEFMHNLNTAQFCTVGIGLSSCCRQYEPIFIHLKKKQGAEDVTQGKNSELKACHDGS